MIHKPLWFEAQFDNTDLTLLGGLRREYVGLLALQKNNLLQNRLYSVWLVLVRR